MDYPSTMAKLNINPSTMNLPFRSAGQRTSLEGGSLIATQIYYAAYNCTMTFVTCKNFPFSATCLPLPIAALSSIHHYFQNLI